MTDEMHCPRCGRLARVTGQDLGEHRAVTRFRCPYSGGTRWDAEAKITPLARWLLEGGHVRLSAGKWVKQP